MHVLDVKLAPITRASATLAAVLATFDFDEMKFALSPTYLIDALTAVHDDIESAKGLVVEGGAV